MTIVERLDQVCRYHESLLAMFNPLPISPWRVFQAMVKPVTKAGKQHGRGGAALIDLVP